MIILILECMLLGIVAALTGIFYNHTLQAGSIFCKLGVILDYWAENKDGFKGWIANPLGACIYCSTTWITIFIMVLYWESWSEPPKWEDIIICTLAAIGTQHIFVRMWCYIKTNVDKANED